MSSVTHAAPTIADYVAVLDDEISTSLRLGRAGDWSTLQRRLRTLERTVRDGPVTATRDAAWAHRLEAALWCDLLLEVVLPDVVADLVGELRSQRRPEQTDLGVWACLDRDAFAEDTRRNRRQEAMAEAALIGALERHSQKPSYRRLFEATRALEDLHDARLAPHASFSVKELVAEGEALAKALRSVLPPPATSLLGLEVELRFRSAVEGIPIDQLSPPEWFWHHRIPGVGVWQPMWTDLYDTSDFTETPGIWFVGRSQEIYDQFHANAFAERSAARDDEDRREIVPAPAPPPEPSPAPAGEGQPREGEPAQGPTGSEEEEEEERERERQRRAARRAEEEIELARQASAARHAEMAAVEASWRAEDKERARQERERAPEQPLFWKLTPQEISDRRAEEAYERWCKDRGLSPSEVPDEYRERFMRHF